MNLALFSGTSLLQFFPVLLLTLLLSAAVDVVVVEGPDGTLRSTPFLVCFSTYNCLTRSHEKVVITYGLYVVVDELFLIQQIRLSINGEPVQGVEMSLGDDGTQARFVGEDLPSERLRALHLKYGSNTAEFSIVTGIRVSSFHSFLSRLLN